MAQQQQQQTPFFQLPAIAKLPKILSQQPVDQVQAADPTTPAGPEYTQFALSQAKPKGSGAPRNVGEGLTYIGEKINEAAWRGEYLKALQGQKTADAAAWGNYTQAMTGGNNPASSAPGAPAPPKGMLSSPPTPSTGPNNGYTPAPQMKAGPAIAGGDLANAAGGNAARGIPGASDPARDGEVGVPAIAKGGLLSAPPSMPKPLQAPQGMTPAAPDQPAQPSDEQMRSMTGAMANAAPQPENQPAQPQAQLQASADPRMSMYDKQIATIQSQMQAAQGLIKNPGTREQGIALLNGLSSKANALEMAKIELQNPANETTRRMNEAHATLFEAQAKKAGVAGDNTPDDRARNAERYGLKPGTGSYQAYVLTGKLPDGTNDSEQSKEFRKEAAKQSAKLYEGHADDGNKAVATLNDIDRLQELSNMVGSGKMAAMMPTVGPWLQSIGLEPKGLQEAQMFEAIINKLAPGLRQAGSGAMSDRDLQIFMSSLPQLSQTKEGRDGIMKQMRAITDYAVQKGRIAQSALSGKLHPQDADAQIQSLQDGLKRQVSPNNSLREKLRALPDNAEVDGASIGQPGKRFQKIGNELHEVMGADVRPNGTMGR